MTAYLLTLAAVAAVCVAPLFAVGYALLWQYERRRRKRAEAHRLALAAEHVRLLAENNNLRLQILLRTNERNAVQTLFPN